MFQPDVNYIYDATMTAGISLDQLLNRCNALWNKDPGLCFYPSINSSMLFEAIKNTDFRGRTGTVQYFGNDRQRGVVDVFQFDDAGDSRFVGFYNGTRTIYIYSSQLEFQGGTVPVSSNLFVAMTLEFILNFF